MISKRTYVYLTDGAPATHHFRGMEEVQYKAPGGHWKSEDSPGGAELKRQYDLEQLGRENQALNTFAQQFMPKEPSR